MARSEASLMAREQKAVNMRLPDQPQKGRFEEINPSIESRRLMLHHNLLFRNNEELIGKNKCEKSGIIAAEAHKAFTLPHSKVVAREHDNIKLESSVSAFFMFNSKGADVRRQDYERTLKDQARELCPYGQMTKSDKKQWDQSRNIEEMNHDLNQQDDQQDNILYLDTASIKRSRVGTGKVKMQVDLTTPRPRHVWIGLYLEDNTIGFWRPVEYENVPTYCEYCKNQVHDIDECKSKLRDEEYRQRKKKEGENKNKYKDSNKARKHEDRQNISK
ncbi:hypothetical protein EJD97_005474 [Solanum chilense]|uniref:Zinc knuckle CX2CX4HX4C domain-containing protein n=1 Tax=Solanum chilense TaxID=4083 RepID=A0A6N2BRI9_SOLCI|nr:hypothetical protein EJD97_005474 [Solanum chilense]